MSVAFICLNPVEIIAVAGGESMTVNVAGKVQAYQVGAGWAFEDYRVVAVIPFQMPEGKRAVGAPRYVITPKGTVCETVDVEDVPTEQPQMVESISRRQFFQLLAMKGFVSQDEAVAAMGGVLPAALVALVDQLPESDRFTAKMLLLGATEFHRSHPLTDTFGMAFGISSAEVDEFWNDAAKL